MRVITRPLAVVSGVRKLLVKALLSPDLSIQFVQIHLTRRFESDVIASPDRVSFDKSEGFELVEVLANRRRVTAEFRRQRRLWDSLRGFRREYTEKFDRPIIRGQVRRTHQPPQFQQGHPHHK
jgi:hypothetical protein